MNDHLTTGPHGLRLLKLWERGPDSVRLSLGGAALDAYLCPGGKWTLGWGCCEWPDGTPVRRGDRLQDEAQAETLLAYNLKRFEDAVKRYCLVPLAQHAFDAHVALAFNIGAEAYRTSSVLRLTNERADPELIASKFGMWTGATTTAPSRSQVSDPAYADCIGEKVTPAGRTTYFWKGPDGEPCGYMTRLSGLLARHYSEGLLSLGLDWAEACKPGVIMLRATHPSRKTWNPARRRWEDGTERKTEFAEVLATARRFPLSAAPVYDEDDFIFEANAPLPPHNIPHEDPAEPDASAQAESDSPQPPTEPASVPGPPLPQDAPAVTAAPVPATVPAPVGTAPISPNTKKAEEVPYGVDPTAGAKPMGESRRFIAEAMLLFATVLRSISAKTQAAGTIVSSATGTLIAAFLALWDNPDTRAIMVGVVVTLIGGLVAGIAAIGVNVAKAIDRKAVEKKRIAETEATQLLY